MDDLKKEDEEKELSKRKSQMIDDQDDLPNDIPERDINPTDDKTNTIPVEDDIHKDEKHHSENPDNEDV